jgi:N-acyl-D-amino-acid deacylase
MRKRTLLLLALLAVVTAISWRRHAASAAAEFDLLITGGRVVDGTGNPWFRADVVVKDGRIAWIGSIDPSRAARVIDAKDSIIAPGFIDVHTHIESNILDLPAAENFLRMGVTSVVTGNCGGSALPIGAWFTRLEEKGVSINVAALVGHNTVRRVGMNGDFDRPPATEELQKMRELVDQAMRDGAVGLSTGLEYIPGTYATTDEIVELAKVAAKYGGVYASHMRNEGLDAEKSINEALTVGAQSGCPVEISHFKVSSKKRWGASAVTIKMVEEARARGQQVTVDQYLYPAGSTGIGILFPSWLFEGGNDKARERLQDAATRERVKRELIAKAAQDGFNDFSFAFIANHSANQDFNGKNIAEVTKIVKQKTDASSQAEQAIDLLLAGGAQMVLHKMSDQDVERIFKQPFTMVASDAGVIDPASQSIPHPRGFGNNARVLGLYVRAKRLVGLEEAIRKMSSLPAQTFKLWDRGLLRPGMAADIVIFDEKTVAGIDYVIINGQVVIEKGSHNGAKPGRILRKM